MVIGVVVGVSMLSGCSAHADSVQHPLAKVDTSVVFPSADEAARAALKLAAGQSTQFEYGGVVISCRGDSFSADFWEAMGRRVQRVAYYHTIPVTSYSRSSVNYDVAFPKGCSIAAIYHTHPAQDVNSRLSLRMDAHVRAHSKDDIATATRIGAPSYIAVVGTGEVLVWSPPTVRLSSNSKE